MITYLGEQLAVVPLAKPGAPTLVVRGSLGGTTYGYKVVARHTTGHSEASDEASVLDGFDPLSPTDFIEITPPYVSGVQVYDIYRTTGGDSQGQLGILVPVVSGTTQLATFPDYGQPAIPGDPPDLNTTGLFYLPALAEDAFLQVGTDGVIVGTTELSGVISFLDLTDTLSDYTGRGNELVYVLGTEDGLGTVSLDALIAAGPDADSTHKGFLTAANWSTFNAKVSPTRTLSTTTPLSGGGDLSADRTLTIANAAADGTTKGASTFTATEFASSAGLIALAQIYTRSKALSDIQTALFDVALAAGAMAGGVVLATVRASDGTNHQVLTQVITWAAVNKGGAYTLNVVITPDLEVSALTAGALSATWDLTSGTNKATMSITPTGSLTETTYTVHYSLINNSPQAITIV